MRKTLLFLIGIISTSCIGLKKKDSFDGHNGNPKEVEFTVYKEVYKDSILKLEQDYKYTNFYNERGWKTKTQSFNSDDSPTFGGWKYQYDKKGNQIEKTMFANDSVIFSHNNCKFNKYGQLIEIENIKKDKKFKWKYVYYRKERKSETYDNKEGYFKKRMIIKYDKKWRKTETISFNDDGIKKSRIEMFYDSKNNEIKSKWYNSNDELYALYKTTYNFNNDRIRIEYFRMENGILTLKKDTKFENKYDKKENCIEERISVNEKVFRVKRIKYVW